MKNIAELLRKNQQGLIDLKSLIVGIIVAAILAAGAGFSVMAYVNFAAVDDARMKTKTLKQALETYYTDHDSYPEHLQTLKAEKYIPLNVDITLDSNNFIYEACFTQEDVNKNYAQKYILVVRIGNQEGAYYAHEAREVTPQGWDLASATDPCGLASR